MSKSCSRCGGTGLVSRGNVVNGICFRCGGNGHCDASPKALRPRRPRGTHQWALIDAEGRYLAVHTDRAQLERLIIPTAIKIVAF